ncbi:MULTISPECIES: outer membrane protein [unclassified Bradyrhizobium]|uniref:outer membrane protein n=1 Tax=unclassified Bradyrhizobium TaxID=2631580 RepID=UPI001FF9DCB6|nr:MULTISPECIES: outer membrane protein [unclassified Bradyrhizobium]MCK1483059.1 porin family protein [Bradyrhizobium sp. 193]MCK1504359.1 porin family protein [Bradyrhizobium sp. 18]UPJ70913.1 porin family protein [Bradyrhizobium sp. 187]UPK13840.1 porin family protein [Bradyrhizobium sp. 155]UPK17245.1 porin family protein [Bradyrhizobium sp. 131]
MKRIVIGMAAAMSLFATGALAADLAARPYVKAPVMVDPVWSWTGFYVGANGGYSWGRSRTDVSYFNSATGAAIAPPAGSITNASFDMNGGIAGGQAGYNWQSANWVYGIEGDLQWSGEKGRAGFNCAPTGPAGGACLPGLTFLPAGAAAGTSLTIDQHLQWFGTVRGRVGILATPKVLFYGTGGLAFGEIKTTGTMSGFTPAGVAVGSVGSNSTTRAGWTAGVGVEGKITQNWSAKLEYLYMDLGRFGSGPFTLAPLSTISANVSSRFTDHILRAGINYQFGGPVVARY